MGAREAKFRENTLPELGATLRSPVADEEWDKLRRGFWLRPLLHLRLPRKASVRGRLASLAAKL